MKMFLVPALLLGLLGQTTTTKMYRLPVVAWTAPANNADGSVLDDLAGFRLVVTAEGDDPAAVGTALLGSVNISDPAAVEYRGTALWDGVPLDRVSLWIAAFDLTGNASGYAGPVVVDRRDLPPAAPGGVTVKVVVVSETEIQ